MSLKLNRLQHTLAPILLISGTLLALAGCGSEGPTQTPAPTATSTPKPTPTPRPDGLRVVQADFGDPVEGTVFEELLARYPDDDASRASIQLFDTAGILAALGLEPPAPGAGTAAWAEIIDEASNVSEGNAPILTQLSAVIPLWPQDMRPYLDALNWYPDVAFDFASVEQHARNNIPLFLGQGDGIPGSYEVAFGKFDPGATEAALAACGCDQPDLNDYGGFTYYSWDEEYKQDLSRRLAPPLYDNLGRGPRVLVRDGEAFWTTNDAAMELYIDVLNETQPSLATDPDYITAIRWMAAMGTIDNMVLASRGLGIDSIAEPEQLLEEIMQAPLLKPFSAFAYGAGYDGERIFDAIVVVHEDEATSEENVALLLDRIGVIRPNAASEIEVEVEGRFLLLRAYGPYATGARLMNPGLNTLLVHE